MNQYNVIYLKHDQKSDSCIVTANRKSKATSLVLSQVKDVERILSAARVERQYSSFDINKLLYSGLNTQTA